MAVNTTGITPAANFIPEVWVSELSDATQANMKLTELVDRSFEDDMKFGDIAHIQDISNPSVRIKTEDTTATWSNRTEPQQNITINRQAYCAFLVEDIAELQSKYAIRSEYTQKTSYSLMAFVEGDITSGLTSLPANFSQLVGTLGSDPTDDDLLRAKQYLDDGDVPDTDRFIYASPAFHNALLKMNKFTSADFVGSSSAAMAVKRGVVGQAYGAAVSVSSLANNNPAAANQSYSWFCHRRGTALIMQRGPKVHTQEIILEVGMGVLVDMVYQFAERLIAPSTLGGGTSDDRFNVGVRAA